MQTLSLSSGETQIKWKQLWSLAALYGSIVIGWIAYQNYQPKLLEKFNFTDFSFILLVFQGIILVITPPIAGKLGDRYRFKAGHRIPIITTGISFAAMVFMAVAFTLLGNPGEIFKWVLPVLIVFWLIAMSIFTSPALSTLELFTPVDKLPSAMAILTIVANLIYSLEPVIIDIIDYLGAPLTFMAGGAVVFLSGYALKKTSLSLFKHSENKEARPIASMQFDTTRSNKPYIFFLGLALGIPTAILFKLFPDLLGDKLGVLLNGIDGKIMLVDLLVLSAILSIPVSNLVTKLGLEKSFWWSLAIIIISTIFIFTIQSPVIVLIMTVIFTVMFTALSVSSLPMAINNSNYYEKVFCVGIFFSGVAVLNGIIEAIQAF
ncbi:MAG TPA: MFS transporter [Chryseolinea sp.]|nr:MFS transporter [Chryseolinea sp.]HPM30159.1 MFS transporter [Chryseolinea sp.]